MKERLLIGLDVGTTAIRLAAGKVSVGQDRRLSLNIVGGAEVASQGVSKGSVSSIEDTVSAISSCLEQAERVIGEPLVEAAVGIGGTYITSQDARGVIGVSRTDGDIRAEDVARAIEAAKTFVNPANQEILHVLPRSFSIDGQSGIKDPVGMQGIRLEVDALIVQGLSSHVRNFTRAVFRTGLDITELVYAPLASGEAITTARQRELGVCVVTIGGATTGVSVYENGELLRAVTIPIGADHITNDLAIGLRVSLETAEKIKRVHGTAFAESVPKRSGVFDLIDYGGDTSEEVSFRLVADIIEARVEEMFEKVVIELRKIDREGLLPSGIVLTGGGAKLPGMIEVGKKIMRLPCSHGVCHISSSLPEMIQDSAFSTSLGLVQWQFEHERRAADGVPMYGNVKSVASKGGELLGKIGNPLKKIFKSFIP
ncbi:cell division protein FtsA [Candidatus Uhrbacteria bacterium]|nr:cell division protein FtsA [Candidatus Uhrbacteria bacterium]